jgi:hypothetical protein
MKILKSVSLMSLVFATVLLGFGSSIAQAATYTMADVRTHNTPTDCWVVVNDNVYNLTSFVTSHSGGASVITAQCGKNGTASFTSGPHSASTLSAISSSLLGPLTVASQTHTLTSVKVTPASSKILVGKTVELTAVAKDQNGKKLGGATTTFKSSDTSIARVDSDTGVVTGVALGTVTITSTSTLGNEKVTGTAVVKVVDTTIKPINTDNNGKHLGQYKHWFEKWFKKWEKKWEKRHNENIKNDHGNNNQNDQESNDTEENDD